MKRAWIFLLPFLWVSCTRPPEALENQAAGSAQGSTYNIKYITDEPLELQASFDSIFRAVDESMSTYMNSSLISVVNRGDTSVPVDPMFKAVLTRSIEIADETGGLFDPTVGPLVELWGFGKNVHLQIDSSRIDSTREMIGYERIVINGPEVEIPLGFRIDFNAIAQGYTVDLLAEYLEKRGIGRYMVEVGGEVRAHGLNIRNEPWKIGVDKPSEEIDENDRFQIIIGLKDKAMATSGNYRKFWVDQETGIKYAHTIDPLTGFPARNKLLSVTLLADNCMDADAYATACMVMGTERALRFIEGKDGIEGYLIYSDEAGDWQVAQSSGFASYILK